MSSRLLLLVALLFAVAYGAFAQNSTLQYGCRTAAGWSAPGKIINPPPVCSAATGQNGCCGLTSAPAVNPPTSTCTQSSQCADLLQQHVFCGVSCAPFWDNAEVKFSVCSNQLAYIFATCRDSTYLSAAGTCQPFSRVFDADAFLDAIMVNGSSRVRVVTDSSACYDRSIDGDVVLYPNFVTRSALPITFNVSGANIQAGDNFYVVPGEQDGCMQIHPNATSFVADQPNSFTFNFMAYKFGLHSLCRRVSNLINDTIYFEWQPTGQYIFVQLNKMSFTPDSFFTTSEPQYIKIFGSFFGDLFKVTSAASCAGEVDNGVQLFNDAFTYAPTTAGTVRVCVQPAGATRTYIGLGNIEITNVISFYPSVFERKRTARQVVNILGAGPRDQFAVAKSCNDIKSNDPNIVPANNQSPVMVSFAANTQGELQVCRRNGANRPFASIGKIFVSLEVILEPERVFASSQFRTFEVYGAELNDMILFVPKGQDCDRLNRDQSSINFPVIPGYVVQPYSLTAMFDTVGQYDACLQACDYPDPNGNNCFFKEHSASVNVVAREISAITVQPTNVMRTLFSVAFEVTGAEQGDVFSFQKVPTCDEPPFPNFYDAESGSMETIPFAIGDFYLCVQSEGQDAYTAVSDFPMITVYNPSDRITPSQVIGNTGMISLYPESVDSNFEFIAIQNNSDCSAEFGGFAELDLSWQENAPNHNFTIDSSTYLPGVYSVCLWDPLRNTLNLQTTFEVRPALALSPRRVSRSLNPRNFTITNAREGDKFKFDMSQSCDGDFEAYDVIVNQDADTAARNPTYITHIPENPLTTMLCMYNDHLGSWIYTGLSITIPYIVSPPGAQRATELTYTVNQLLPGDQFLLADPDVPCSSTNPKVIRPITVNTTTNQFNYTTFLASGDLALCVKSAISSKYYPYTYITVSSGLSYIDRFYRQFDIQTLYIVGAFRDDTFHLRTMGDKLVDRGRFNDIKIDLKHSARYRLSVSNPRFLEGQEVFVSLIHVFIDLDPAYASVEENPNIKVRGMLDSDNLYALVPERYPCPDPSSTEDNGKFIVLSEQDQESNSFDYLFENKDVGWLALCVRDSETSPYYKANLERGFITYPLCPRDQWGSDCYTNGVCNNGTCACYAPARGEGCNRTSCDLSLEFPQSPLFTPNRILTQPWLPPSWSIVLDGDYFLSIRTFDATDCQPEIIFAWTITDYLNGTGHLDEATGVMVPNYIVATYTDSIYIDPFIFKPDFDHTTVLDAEFSIPSDDGEHELTFYGQRTVVIKTALPILWTEIGGGDRLVSLEESLILDGSLSLDLADPFCRGKEAECLFKWTCTTEMGADCSQYIDNSEEEVTIVDSAIGTGNFTFGLYFQKNWLGKERNATAQNVTLEIVNGTQPLVFVERYRDDFRAYQASVVADNYFIAYVDMAESIQDLPYSYTWSCEYYNTSTASWIFFGPNINPETKEVEDSRFTALPSLLIINGFSLKSAVQYRCRLDVQCTDPLYSDIRGHGNSYFNTVPPPFGGTCNVTVPSNPDNTSTVPAALGNKDTVQILCGDWRASQGGNPIRFYGFVNKEGAGPFDDILYVNLDDGLNRRLRFTMPPVEQNGTIYNVNINIIDKRGGLATVSVPVIGLKTTAKAKSSNGKTTDPNIATIQDTLFPACTKAFRARKVDDLLISAASLAFFIDYNIDPSTVSAEDMVYVNEVKLNTTQFINTLINVTRNAVQVEQAATILQKFSSRDAPTEMIEKTTAFVKTLLDNPRGPVNDRSARNVIKSLASSTDNAAAAAQRAHILRSMGLYKEAANAPDPRAVAYENIVQVNNVMYKVKMSSPSTPVEVDNGQIFAAAYTTSFNKTAQTGNGPSISLPENIASYSSQSSTRGSETHNCDYRGSLFENPSKDDSTYDNSLTRQTTATSEYNYYANDRGEKTLATFSTPASNAVQICMPVTDAVGANPGPDSVQEVMYYNTTTGQWSTEGIVFVGVTTKNGKTCILFNTTHFSFFGSFVSFLKPRTSPAHSLTLFSGSFLTVALASVLATLFVYARRD